MTTIPPAHDRPIPTPGHERCTRFVGCSGRAEPDGQGWRPVASPGVAVEPWAGAGTTITRLARSAGR